MHEDALIDQIFSKLMTYDIVDRLYCCVSIDYTILKIRLNDIKTT